MPGYANPQNLNRYSYVVNNPLRYTDPTGHMQVEDGPQSNGCSNPTYCQNGKPNPPIMKPKEPKDKGGNKGECTTITCQAFQGNLGAIADLLIPSHIGWRWQGELSLTLGTGVGLGPSSSLGLNGIINRKSGEIAFFADYSGEGGIGVGNPFGLSVTTGPIVGWGSSTVKNVAIGNSAIVSGTVAPDIAASFSVSAPVEGISLEPHIDPVYGQIPATAYVGGGGGTAYGGLGAGGSHVFASAILDLFPLSASVIADPFP